MGALGLLYGSYFENHIDFEMHYLMDALHYQKYSGKTVLYNGIEKKLPTLKSDNASHADFIIIAVKYNDLPTALDTIKSSVGDKTIIISVLNGISSEEIIGKRYGMQKMIYSVAQGMDAMKIRNEFHYTNPGSLHIGATNAIMQKNLEQVIQLFQSVQLPFVVEEDIIKRMWNKFMLNVGVNQTCMIYQATYKEVLQDGQPNRIMISAMREVIAIANQVGVPLEDKNINEYVAILKTLSPDGRPSMAQDRINRKRSEVEMFAGTIIELAKKYDIYVPVNQYLYQNVKQIEETYSCN